MAGAAAQVVASVHHVRFLIFDWSVPNLIMGAVLVIVFFAGAWMRLPKWIERGRERREAGRE
jgi:protein-S-isoprenylcysteine O-methyltransferase Ste14